MTQTRHFRTTEISKSPAHLSASLLAAILLFVTSAYAENSDGLDATYILERIAKAYAECYTYQDTGTVRTVFISEKRRWTEETKFDTAFARPTMFRFEFRKRAGAYEEDVYIVHRDENGTSVYWDLSDAMRSPESLASALAGATGVSGGSAHTVPVLLLPNEVSGRRVTNISEPKRITDSECMGGDCFRITGNYGNSPMTLWVDKETYLLRIIKKQTGFDDFRTETMTTYEPIINSEIDDNALTFNAPKSE